MTLFLDTSVLLAASGSETGAARALFPLAQPAGWRLVTSPYAVNEVLKNLPKFPALATATWLELRRQLIIVDDVVSLNRPVLFTASKDRPILFTALAWAEVLLTLDRSDFADLLGGQFYGLRVRLPSTFSRRSMPRGAFLSVDSSPRLALSSFSAFEFLFSAFPSASLSAFQFLNEGMSAFQLLPLQPVVVSWSLVSAFSVSEFQLLPLRSVVPNFCFLPSPSPSYRISRPFLTLTRNLNLNLNLNPLFPISVFPSVSFSAFQRVSFSAFAFAVRGPVVSSPWSRFLLFAFAFAVLSHFLLLLVILILIRIAFCPCSPLRVVPHCQLRMVD